MPIPTEGVHPAAHEQARWTETAYISTRSPRVVVVFDSGPESLAPGAAENTLGSTFHRILEWFGRVWGGKHMFAIPAVNGEIADIFRRLAAAYDPDLVLPWGVSLSEIELRDPERGARLAARVAGVGTTFADVSTVEARRISTKLVDIGGDHAEAFDAAFENLKSELNPFNLGSRAESAHHLQVDFPRPLTSLAALGPMAIDTRPTSSTLGGAHVLSGSVTDLDLSGADSWLATLMKIEYGVTGAPPASNEPRPPGETPAYRTFEAHDPQTRTHAANRAFRAFETTAPSSVSPPSTDLELAAAAQPDFSGTEWFRAGAMSSSPMRRSGFGLEGFSYTRNSKRPILIVVGDSAADAALYQAWTQVYGRGTAAWAPASVAQGVVGDDSEALTEIMAEMIYDIPGLPREHGWIASFTVNVQNLEAFRSSFAKRHWSREVQSLIGELRIVSDPDDIMLSPIPDSFLVMPDTYATARTVAFHNGDGQTPLLSPIPSIMQWDSGLAVMPLKGNWVAEAIVGETLMPAHRYAANAAEVAGNLTSLGDLRCGRTGTSWIAVSTQEVPAGLNAENALNAFVPAAPNVLRVIGAMLDPEWEWQLSTAGRYYEGFTAMCGGLEPLLELLTDAVAAPLLQAFLKNGPGFDLAAGKAMTLGDMQEVLGLTQLAPGGVEDPEFEQNRRRSGALVDSLVVRGILTPGLVLQCDRCRHTAFYALTELAQHFICKRCSHAQLPVSKSWQPRSSTPPLLGPGWFYRLDGLVQQALEHHIEVPALALHRLGADKPDARYAWAVDLTKRKVGDAAPVTVPAVEPAPQLEVPTSEAETVTPPKPPKNIEVDFVALVDGQLVVGEAKSGSYLGKDTRKTIRAEIASTAKAARLLHAERVVFATTRASWKASSAKAIEEHRQYSSADVVSWVNLAAPEA